MYKKYNISLITIIIFSTSFFTNNVSAMNCYEKSPNLITLKDKYYNIDTAKIISYSETTKLNNLFDKIIGKWEGKSIFTECTGPDRAPRKKTTTASIIVKIKSNSNDNLLMVAKKSYPNNVIRYDGLELLGDLRIFEFNFLTDNNVIFSERAIKKNENKSSRYIETIYEIKFVRKSLTLVRSYYTSGVLVSEEKWSMN